MATGKENWDRSVAMLKTDFKKYATKQWRDIRAPLSRHAQEEAPKEQEQTHLALGQQFGPFQYSAIPNKGYIRLLELMPGQENEPIQIQLSTVGLDDSIQTYDALSYVWGDPDQPRRAISVNGGYMEIYESLHAILLSLRTNPESVATSQVDERCVLWVDAICINQTDMAERGAQVPIMDNIYRNARRTVIWLGPETKETDHIFEILDHLARDANTTTFDASLSDFIDEQATLPITLIQLNKTPLVQSPARELYAGDSKIWGILTCTWWYRSWTLQEILLSTNITLVMGRHNIDWQNLCAAVDHGLRMRLWNMLASGTFINPNILPYFTIRALQGRLGLYESTHHGSRAEHGPGILLTLLEGCRQRESKDPRDKIYAVSGILKTIQRLSSAADAVNWVRIDADYASPVVFVYRMMSQQLILTTGTLDVLGICPRSSRRGLPSWVTDWSNSSSMAVPLSRDSLDRPRRTHAARGTPANARFPEDAVTLVLRGHEVATVSEISKSIPRWDHTKLDTTEEEPKDQRWARLRAEAAANGEEEPSRFALRMTYLKNSKEDFKSIFTELAQHWHAIIQWERFAARRKPTNPCGLDAEAAAVYWKTLCAGTYDHENPAATEELYHKWSRSLDVLRKNESRYGSLGYGLHPLAYFLQSWDEGFPEFALYCECAIERRLGWCENGWLALLPEATCKGDKIVLAEGGRVPLVLRPNGDGYNTFVGEAYVHGIMNGEAFDQSQCHDIKIC
ncbi:heterokaryon incompatibility protein 6, OR allele [Colletotrichum spaethianum]|uniref:Heterokaryon incompatibility protein 6, OR allele n=1 Tax=Colletotrichum spaethianum TaxID=700344 RepID=A0AA37P0C2_9PEZI|nr:heterokaryon incompatibility protein 6, OR allele [Colletotrichum spaethianum]GKT45410.1 heterokaryon incompatibility protein 6, OR allele [Colletotrichum spaethianum]